MKLTPDKKYDYIYSIFPEFLTHTEQTLKIAEVDYKHVKTNHT